MPPTSSTSSHSADSREPSAGGPAGSARRLHVWVTPTEDRRALLSSLAALATALEPRLEVTALGSPDIGSALQLDRRFRLLSSDAALRTDPLTELGLEAGSVLFILRAGALPPRGWIETLLEHGKDPRVRAVAALPWQPKCDLALPDELRRWENEERLSRRSYYRLVEDRAELESPMIALFRPAELAAELTSFMQAGARNELSLPPRGSIPTQRLLVAKDLSVWQDPACEPLRARAVPGGPQVRTPHNPAEARALADELHAALELGQSPAISLRLARLQLSRGDRIAAIQHARACLDGWPECAEAKLYMARAMTGEGRLPAARALIESLLHAGPLRDHDRASVFACLASIWLHSGDTAQAQPCLDVALSISPDDPLARYCQARVALAAGRFGEALEHLEMCLAAVPLSPDMHFELGRTRVLAGMQQAGREALLHALELNPEHKKAEALLERLDPLQ